MSSLLGPRPPYGEGHLRASTRTLAESGLPVGDPAGRGISLDEGISGYKTFAKPVDDIRDDKTDEGSIYRKDGPGDLAKEQSNPEGDRRQLEYLKPTFVSPGGRPKDDPGLTRYPYRDGKPNTHNASAKFVTERWLLQGSPEVVVCSARNTKIAADLSAILQGLNPKILEKARLCAVDVKRADIPNLRWLFAVNCGNGAKVVHLRADRRNNAVQFSKLDLHVACSCPAWRWHGPEFHSTTKDYQDPKTPLQGTASTPDIRDPERVNRVCKHVAAVLAFTRDWTLPKPKGK